MNTFLRLICLVEQVGQLELTVDVDIQSPYPGDEDQWETLHTFGEKGTFDVNMVGGRQYRVVASEVGPWVWLNIIKVR